MWNQERLPWDPPRNKSRSVGLVSHLLHSFSIRGLPHSQKSRLKQLLNRVTESRVLPWRTTITVSDTYSWVVITTTRGKRLLHEDQTPAMKEVASSWAVVSTVLRTGLKRKGLTVLFIIIYISVGTKIIVACSAHICRVSLIAQLVKHLPVMQETPVWFLGQEDPLEKG